MDHDDYGNYGEDGYVGEDDDDRGEDEEEEGEGDEEDADGLPVTIGELHGRDWRQRRHMRCRRASRSWAPRVLTALAHCGTLDRRHTC